MVSFFLWLVVSKLRIGDKNGNTISCGLWLPSFVRIRKALIIFRAVRLIISYMLVGNYLSDCERLDYVADESRRARYTSKDTVRPATRFIWRVPGAPYQVLNDNRLFQ
jgi:hypothetical protein